MSSVRLALILVFAAWLAACNTTPRATPESAPPSRPLLLQGAMDVEVRALVNLLEHPGPNCQNVNIGTGVRLDPFGGECTWNVRNRNNQVVASGVYFYHIEAGDARRIGRMTVVNYAN